MASKIAEAQSDKAEIASKIMPRNAKLIAMLTVAAFHVRITIPLC